MKKRIQIHTVEWDYIAVPDAETRLKAAYDLLLSYPQEAILTEDVRAVTMPSSGADP